MHKHPALWPILLLQLVVPTALAAEHPTLGAPVVQKAIPTPAEAVRRMAVPKLAKKPAQKAAHKPAGTNPHAGYHRDITPAEPLRQATILPAKLPMETPAPAPLASTPPTLQPLHDSLEARLDRLVQLRKQGAISGEEYLSQRHQLIYGRTLPTPPRQPAVASTPTVEQKLASLESRRKRSEISGDQYLASRRQILNGQ